MQFRKLPAIADDRAGAKSQTPPTATMHSKLRTAHICSATKPLRQHDGRRGAARREFTIVAREDRLARKTNRAWYYAIHNLKQHHFFD
jgi:hypothetical protein